jgi:potassium-dependent mechanosensitive channel
MKWFNIIILFFIFSIPVFPMQGEIATVVDSLLQASDITEVAAVPKPSLEGSIRKTQEYSVELNAINRILLKELDTLEILEVLPQAENLVSLVSSRLESKGSSVNLQYIKALRNLTNTVQIQIEDLEKKVLRRTEQLAESRLKLDEMRQSELFLYNLRDTTLLPEYHQAISLIRSRVNHADSLLNGQRILTAGYQSRISGIAIKITELADLVDTENRRLEQALFKKENSFIWEKSATSSNVRLRDLIRESLKINEVIFTRYVGNHLGITLFLLIIATALSFWVYQMILRIKKEKEFSKIILQRAIYVPRSPILIVLLIVLVITPFFYTNPPISFVSVISLLLVLITTVLLHKSIKKEVYWHWLLIFGIFFIYTLSNLYWEIAFKERWYLLLLSIAAIVVSVRLIAYQKKSPDSLPDYMVILLQFFIGMQSFSVLANVLGRFSLGKMLGVAATTSFVQAVSLYLFVLLIMEIVYLQIELSRKSENDFTSYIDFHGIQSRLKKLLTGLAFVIWVYYLLENLSLWEVFIREMIVFLNEPRTLMNASFTFGSILVFILVIYVASVLANNIAYFASIRDEQRADVRDKRLGSSILLIRLGILSLGFFIAVGFSGIPLDKIAIVLGALSVGIGFGLQNIVNNLVSGIILAFERPIQIGDAIEVGGRSGIVKDIGIRSSKLKGYDGSEVIIPNGDLLSQHLINWTLSDKQRRVELLIGVSYGSDVNKVTEIIQKQLDREEILTQPESKVFLQNFADSAVEFRVLFWVETIDIWLETRNKVMHGIFQSFKEQGIEIPFPQRDLYLKEFPSEFFKNK